VQRDQEQERTGGSRGLEVSGVRMVQLLQKDIPPIMRRKSALFSNSFLFLSFFYLIRFFMFYYF